jgi:predicted nucleotidyltransferase
MGEGERTEQDDPAGFHRVLGDATRALMDGDVPYVLFGSIAASVYGKPERSGDIDLLIARADVRGALDALARAGFDTEETDPIWLSKAFRNGVMVDLMTQLTGGLFLDDEMLAHARRIELEGNALTVISPEDLIVIEVASNSAESQAHWYVAMRILMRTPIDWDYLLERARLAPRRILALLVYAQSEDIEVPARVVRELLDRIYAPP